MRRKRSMWTVLASSAAIVAGCRGSKPDAASAGSAADGVRIVSLSPAMTRLLVDVGLHDRIVGRSGYCTMLDPGVPVIGNLLDIDFEILVRVDPTHVFVQPPAAGIDPTLADLAEENGWVLVARPLNRVADVQDLLKDTARSLESLAPADRERLAAHVEEIATAIDGALKPAAATGWTGRTLIVVPGDPALAFGSDTYLDEVLTAQGCVNAVKSAGWIEMSLEDVTRLNPAAIVVVRSGAGVDPLAAAGPLATLDVEAIRAGRVGVLSHEEAQLPSTSVVGVAAELSRLLASWGGASP